MVLNNQELASRELGGKDFLLAMMEGSWMPAKKKE